MTRTTVTLIGDGTTLVFEASRPSTGVHIAVKAVRIAFVDEDTGDYDELELEVATIVHRSGARSVDSDRETAVLGIEERKP